LTPTRQQDKPGDRERQQKLRDRRKADGWRRVSVWLSPEQAGRLERHGGDEWLGRTVKQLLSEALQEPERRPAPATTTVSDTGAAPLPDNGKGRAAFLSPEDKAAFMAEVDSLLSQGLSGNDVARKFNNEGRRTVRGSLFVGQILLRDWRKWKATR
jgi:hypothetical protein